jgi:hypothetical protein
MDMKSTKVIKSAKIAKILLQNGFIIKDISEHRNIPLRSIFVFYNSIELETFLSKLENKEKE